MNRPTEAFVSTTEPGCLVAKLKSGRTGVFVNVSSVIHALTVCMPPRLAYLVSPLTDAYRKMELNAMAEYNRHLAEVANKR